MTPVEIDQARILLVDDEPRVLDVLSRVLQRNGLKNIRCVGDAREAMTVFHDFEPDLVVLDMNMPHVTGLELLEQIRAVPGAETVPVLVLSGEADRALRLQALEAGARDYVEKPFDLEAISRIRNHLETRMLYRQLEDVMCRPRDT